MIDIDLPPQLEAMVHQKVASGRYGSASEGVWEALQLPGKEERLREMKLEQLRRDIDEYSSRTAPVDRDTKHTKRDAARMEVPNTKINCFNYILITALFIFRDQK